MPDKLKYVESLHEQREFNRKIVPIKGSWLEIGSFEPVIEKFTIKERWECVDVGMIDAADNSTLTVDLTRQDFNAEYDESRKIISRIMAKHGEVLIDSLRFMIIKGLTTKVESVNDYRKDTIKERLRFVGIEPQSKEAELMEYESKLVAAQKRVENIQLHISSIKSGAQNGKS